MHTEIPVKKFDRGAEWRSLKVIREIVSKLKVYYLYLITFVIMHMYYLWYDVEYLFLLSRASLSGVAT